LNIDLAPRGPADSPFERVAIVGFGLIGGSIALALKRRWPSSVVIAVDRQPIVEMAQRMAMADRGGEDLAAVADADLVVLAAPVLQNVAVLERLSSIVPATTLVTDVGGTKRRIHAAAKPATSLRFIGGHPMAGAARSGLAAARADLFDGHPWILTPGADDPNLLERLEAFIAGLGAVPHIMSADLHDRLIGAVSHLPQVTASALMDVVGRLAGDAGLELAGPGLVDTTRLAASPADIWRDIAATNDDTLREALDALIRSLTDLRDTLGTPDKLDSVFTSATRWRAALLRWRGDA
jgi:prephenate dehydrogenase